MATYAIGDIQGCYATLQKLLQRIAYDPSCDRLWLAGDLVNRGPASLDVLRWAREQGERLVTVLGNHDLHVLALWRGVATARKKDTVHSAFAAPDIDELMEWLRLRPLLHHEEHHALVHAGIYPLWTMETAVACAREAERALRGDTIDELLFRMQRRRRSRWSADLKGMKRLEFILRFFTTMRVCTTDGTVDPRFKAPPEDAPPGLEPWFSMRDRVPIPVRIWFGHWAAMGFERTEDYCALDSGCVWGGHLTAVRLEDDEVFQEPLTDPVDVRYRRR